ncbi:MAG TPA: DUF3782 domain-containing protein, partial [Leptospiraceae bacterium]|nr:DUF3782 domain-containing protein [Leptospiraceae bacterium]HMZ58749.1 DUF3782 domain-containing protein [Leptospiraceae bacterium]HNF12632.1 DUF3782 domain-containing protein [Leptospiraceae bacterium]
EELAEAQRRTELRVEELAEAQRRTELRVEELAEAQRRTELSVQNLTGRTDDLAQAQKRTESSIDILTKRIDDLAMHMKEGFQKVNEQISALGSRWGIMNENTFRRTVHTLLSRAGYTVSKGMYGEREIDIVIKNGEHILLEITSAAVKKDVRNLNRSAEDYFQKTGIEPKLMISSIYISPSVMREITDSPKKIEVFTSEEDE